MKVTFYEAFKSMTDYGMQRLFPNSNQSMNGTLEGLLLGGVAGGKYLLSGSLPDSPFLVSSLGDVQGT